MFGGGVPKLFGGGGGGGTAEPPPPPTPPKEDAASSGSSSGGKGFSQNFNFDPTGLERAAKAAKELDKAKHAGKAFELVRIQEETKQEKHKEAAEAHRKDTMVYEVQRTREKGEQDRKTLDKTHEIQKQRTDYQDKSERNRMSDEMAAKKRMREQELKKQEEMIQRQEQLRRSTLEHEAELREKTDMKKVSAEVEGRIRQERENHDIRKEQIRLEAGEYRETVIEAIKMAGSTIGDGVNSLLSDKEKLASSVIAITAIALGIYTARTGTGVAGKYIEARLGKPSLVRETSRNVGLAQTLNPVPLFRRFFAVKEEGEFLTKEGIVFNGVMGERLNRIAISTKNIKRNSASFQNLLLHGHPGTGKTMFAKALARNSGLDYAIMTGGDVAPLGRDAVTEVHKLFDWAQTTSKGLVLFVDEADAFLQKRSQGRMSEDVRNALNAFLFRTGESTDKFMVVFASNQPEQFDWAVNDRIDEMVQFDLPGKDERMRLLIKYIDTHLLKKQSSARPIQVEGLTEEKIFELADKAEGFSGREISKLAIAWQAIAYAQVVPILTEELVDQVFLEHLKQHMQKGQWLLEDIQE